MAPGASAVRVIPAGAAPSGCEQRGEIAVSVKGKVGFYERNPLRVREELETLARNEGPGLQADTVQPLEEPHDGEQRFAAYRCGGRLSCRLGDSLRRTGSARALPESAHFAG